MNDNMIFQKDTTTEYADGRIVSRTDRIYKPKMKYDGEPFCIVYSESIKHLLDADLSRTAWKALFCLLKRQLPNNMEVRTNGNVLQRMLDEANMARSSWFSSIKELCDADMIKKTETPGTYAINPLHFWKGNEYNRRRSLKEYITYE